MINDKLFSLKKAAEILDVSVKTLQRWDESGKIQVIRTPGNRRRIPKSEIDRLLGEQSNISSRNLIIYGRVSSNEQKKKGDLERQVEYIKNHLDLRVYEDIQIITDVGSGLNDKLKGLQQLMKLVQNGDVTDVAIRYKDRLTRFGYAYLETFFQGYNVKIHVLDNNKKDKTIHEELVEDLISIVTSFSDKLYGIRSGKNKILKEKIEVAIQDVANISDET